MYRTGINSIDREIVDNFSSPHIMTFISEPQSQYEKMVHQIVEESDSKTIQYITPTYTEPVFENILNNIGIIEQDVQQTSLHNTEQKIDTLTEVFTTTPEKSIIVIGNFTHLVDKLSDTEKTLLYNKMYEASIEKDLKICVIVTLNESNHSTDIQSFLDYTDSIWEFSVGYTGEEYKHYLNISKNRFGKDFANKFKVNIGEDRVKNDNQRGI
jgi:hypothetical protein